MTSDLFWIPGPWRGKLAVAARPRGSDWLAEEARGWRKAGLDIVISLLEPAETEALELGQEQQMVELNGISFLSFPIPDRGVPQSFSEALSLVRSISKALDEGKNVAIHCRQGLGRSGLIAAGTLIAAGASADDAIKIVSEARGTPIPETNAQHEWVHQLAAQRLMALR
jgi:protein-tyrosine phosphatase